jgi:uncharacterized protein (DUF1501 family)
MQQPNFLRRDILRYGAATLATSTVLGRLCRPLIAHAASPYVTGYKALVCVFLTGGNNGFNMVVPTTQAAYNTYAASRTNLSIAQNTLLPLNGKASDGNAYGLHPSCPELQALFNAGNLAIVANVGTLVQPTTVAQAQAGSAPLPPQLFSHVDQQNQWSTSIPQSPNLYGWGGRIADLLGTKGVTAKLGFNIDVAGANYWQQGATTLPYTLGTSGAPTLAVTGSGFSQTRAKAVLALQTQATTDPSPFVQAYQSVAANAASKVVLVNNALTAAGDLTTPFPSNPGDGGLTGDQGFDLQLHEVARVIKAQTQIGDARQLFFVTLGGFDTHNGELATQKQLLTYVSSYLNNFWLAMGEINMRQNVTVFTMSDFGRTLGSNGQGTSGNVTAGSDHGWGNHALVLGGAVKGGFYGTMPNLTIGGPNDFSTGRLVPTTSTDQYAATLTSWFGIAQADVSTTFPNLANFPVSNLGFMAS